MTWRIFLLIVIFLAPSAWAADKPGAGEEYFISGIASYEAEDYAQALTDLRAAYELLPSAGDYALLYIAKTYMQTGNASKALESLRSLYEMYPDSLLVEEARGLEVMASLKSDRHGALGLLKRYAFDYPSDMEMKFHLAGILKETGQTDEANRLFKEIYVEAGPRSGEARAELEDGEIGALDLLEGGTNLIRKTRYNEAEKTLRAALGRNERELTEKIIEQLALSLFMQKKYDEASGYFLEVGDLYNAARSFMRSGQKDEFKKAMDTLLDSRDPKGARLMIAYAGEIRRSGKDEEAVELLERVRKIYPQAAEEVLWNTGWIYYRKGDFGIARKTFARLYKDYKDPKYLYWQARASEKIGRDARGLYRKLNGDGFYGYLAILRTDGTGPSPKDPAPSSLRPARMEKVDLLVDAGLKSYAVRELISRAENNRDTESLREVALRLMDLQEYRRAMLVTSTLPEEARPLEILYPLAFWPKVSSSADDYGMDPYLLLSLIREESRFDPRALSPAGAVGLMQLMPQTASTTARELRIPLAGPRSLRDADLNITLGAHYLSILLKQFGSVPAALAAYNAGGSRVTQWLSENDYEASDEFIEDIPFEETRNYVKRIVSSYFHYRLTRPPAGGSEIKIL